MSYHQQDPLYVSMDIQAIDIIYHRELLALGFHQYKWSPCTEWVNKSKCGSVLTPYKFLPWLFFFLGGGWGEIARRSGWCLASPSTSGTPVRIPTGALYVDGFPVHILDMLDCSGFPWNNSSGFSSHHYTKPGSQIFKLLPILYYLNWTILNCSDSLTDWFGVLFIRQGLYQEGIFKFDLLIPENYPDGDSPVSSYSSMNESYFFLKNLAPSVGAISHNVL